jgi:hypothetical protein
MRALNQALTYIFNIRFRAQSQRTPKGYLDTNGDARRITVGDALSLEDVAYTSYLMAIEDGTSFRFD